MTYKDRFAQALKLKDFVSLYNNKAWVCFIFTSDTDFQVKVFDQKTDDETRNHLFVESVYEKKLPFAYFAVCEYEGTKGYAYHDPNFQLHIDLKSGEIMYYQNRDCDSLSLEVLRKDALAGYGELIDKFK